MARAQPNSMLALVSTYGSIEGLIKHSLIFPSLPEVPTGSHFNGNLIAIILEITNMSLRIKELCGNGTTAGSWLPDHIMEEGKIRQDTGNDAPEELPTYNYLEAQERDNPNSRFGRWRSWVEKRAAERYADVSEEDLRRQRDRGWGTALDTSIPGQAPPVGSVMSPMSSQVVSERLGDTRLSVYQFGSRFIPHSSSPIRSLVSLNDDRYLLLGGMDGLGILDVFPDNVNLSVEDASMLHALESATRKDLWTGEAIYQMKILESYPDANGNLQGVLLAIVGADDGENEREPSSKSVRMYNLASIWSLIKYVSSHPEAKPLEIQGPKGWMHQQSSPRRLHRPHTHSLTKSLKAMAIEHHGGRPSTPTGSMASVTAVSIASELASPPKHQDSQDSADSWDMVDDLPLRWASDYVNLASAGSKLASSSALFFELWKNEGVARSTSMLAVATKGCILLYETPKGERSFRFVKEFFTPLPAKSINFVQTTSTETVKATSIQPEGEKIKKERPLSKLGHDSPIIKSPRTRRLSIPGDHTYGSQLSLFVVFEKRACLIRITDSSVSEIELWDDGGGPPSPTATSSLPNPVSPTSHSSHGFRKSMQSFDTFSFAREGKGLWLPMLTLEIPYPPSADGEPDFATTKTILIMSRGRRTHILSSPLPIPLSSKPPLHVIRWHSQPRQVAARLSAGLEKQSKLQVLGFTDHGVEIVETGVNFIFKPPDLGPTLGKGKGKVKSISLSSEPLVRATWESPDVTGYLGRGGFWHTLDTTSGRPELRNILSESDLSACAGAGSRTEIGQGIYAWTQKGLEDYRVVWLGDGTPGEQV